MSGAKPSSSETLLALCRLGLQNAGATIVDDSKPSPKAVGDAKEIKQVRYLIS